MLKCTLWLDGSSPGCSVILRRATLEGEVWRVWCVSKGTSQQNYAGHSWSWLPSWFLLFNSHFLSGEKKSICRMSCTVIWALQKCAALSFMDWSNFENKRILLLVFYLFFKTTYSQIGDIQLTTRGEKCTADDHPLTSAIQIKSNWQPVFSGIVWGINIGASTI